MRITEWVRDTVEPFVKSLGLEVWDVEFKKEGADYYLRVLIDRPDGAVGIADCEAVSRYLDPLLDEADPIEQSYLLEVSSAGLVRELRTDAHLARFRGSEVEVFAYKKLGDLPKHFSGTLEDFNASEVCVRVNGAAHTLARTGISKITVDLL